MTSSLLTFFLFPLCASAGLSPNAESLMNEGVAALYNLDYHGSRAAFQKIIEAEPDNPFGYLFEAGGIWWESSQEYGLFKDTPTLQGRFEWAVNMAIKKAEPLLKSPSPEIRADAQFVMGMALGTRGQWALLRGHPLRACFDGRKAVKYLNKCLKTDAEHYDAYLGLGVYDYQAARLPAVLKLSAALCGAHGSEKRGIERMHLAMEKGRYGSRQAMQFLLSIYIMDYHDHARAYSLLQRLRRHFPDSRYFEFLEIALRYRLGDRNGSIEEGRRLFEWETMDFGGFNRRLLTLVCGMAGDKCLNKNDVLKAHAWFTHALEAEAQLHSIGASARSSLREGMQAEIDSSVRSSTATLAWLSFNHLFRGYASDALGRREEAQNDYRWVLAHPDLSDFHARASECHATPCIAASLRRYLRALSRGETWPPTEPESARRRR